MHAQILVATSTLAWGVNTPAHLVVIKGTEYYDAPSRRYVDFPITDVLQVCPGWEAVACVRDRYRSTPGAESG
jgi:replicative superfamily II helicase